MSAIRVSGRKNSGINIAGLNSQGGEHSYLLKKQPYSARLLLISYIEVIHNLMRTSIRIRGIRPFHILYTIHLYIYCISDTLGINTYLEDT